MPAQPDGNSSELTGLDALSGAVDAGPEPVPLSEAIAEWLASVQLPGPEPGD